MFGLGTLAMAGTRRLPLSSQSAIVEDSYLAILPPTLGKA